MKRTVEIDDTLQDDVQTCKEELLEDFIDYLRENPDTSDFDEYYQNQGCDRASEIADSSTPIYYSDIDGLYYLYGNEFDEAYNNAGIGNGTEDGYRQVAIYCYLSEKTFEFMHNLESWFDSFDQEYSLVDNREEELESALDELTVELVESF